ncbi:MAG: hypothetical protein JNM98_01360, partial [Rhodocyclaceae bacterium]|nr:hypothetical protein [Rhodocyclaceae bacterium]
TNRGHAFRAIAAYATWLAREGAAGARELAALRLVGFFDRPASRANLAALREAPAIAGLSDALISLDEADWNCTLANLAQAGLLRFDADSGSLDAHPLVREYFARYLEQDQFEAWREGHRRVYVQLKTDTPQRPDGLAGLQPLYQAVAHGCKAGLYQEALAEVYDNRILRGTGRDGFYSTNKLGAFGADLGAVACFFVEPWRRPAPQLQEDYQAWLLNQAGLYLRAMGRLAEALEPMRAGAEMRVRQEVWKSAAIIYGNLSELQLTLGHIAAAVQDAARAVEYADRSGDAFERMSKRTTLADARQQQGETGHARERYTEAEAMQAEDQPQYPLLYSLRGFRYCELLLVPMERAALLGAGDEAALQACAEVARRAAQTLEWFTGKLGLLDEALDHLNLARSALYTDLLQNRPPSDDARRDCESAVSGLRAAGRQDHLPRGLLTRAWLRHACGDTAGCRADLQEVETIASRGGMKLFLADLALTRARLFRDRAQLHIARDLITECGYGRRLPELQDAEALAASWPDVNSAPPSDRLADGTPEASIPSPAAENPAEPPKPARTRKSRKPAMPPANIDFLIVTPLQEERDAVLARLPAYRKLPPTADDIRVYYAAEIAARFPDGSPVRYATVLLPLGGMGDTEAATATADAIRRWNPRYVLLAGIAGGIAAAGVNVGDVLIADQIADYELAKVLPSGPQIRWQTHTVDRRLLIAAQNFDGGDFRSTQAARFDDAEPALHFGPICTGNKVLADDSLAQQLREVWVKMIGVEMEAAGVANAASQSARQPGFFMVRGVSDLADSSKDSIDVKRWRPYACEIAAAWAIEFLKSGPVPAAEPAPTRQAPPAAAPPPVPKGKRGARAAPKASSKAVAVWQDKLEFLREKQASCADPAQLFSIKKQIEEAEAKIRELS